MNLASSGLVVSVHPACYALPGSNGTEQRLGLGSVVSPVSAQSHGLFNSPFTGVVNVTQETVGRWTPSKGSQGVFVPSCWNRSCSLFSPLTHYLPKIVQTGSCAELSYGGVRCADCGCQKAFSDPGALRRQRHCEKLFRCPKAGCDKAYTRKYNLNNHLRVHSGERPFLCSYPGCGSSFTRSAYLNSHKKTHLVERQRYQCEFCRQFFNSRNTVLKHTKRNHMS